jgi:hypothetical protein
MSARRLASRRRMGRLGALRHLFWVVLVTLLIWVYADMEHTNTQTITITLELDSGDPSKLAILSSPTHSLSATLSGSKSSIEELRRNLALQGNTLTCDVSHVTPGKPVLFMADRLLRDQPLLKGILIDRVDPPGVEVQLDPVVRIKGVMVTLASQGAELQTPPEPQPVDILVSKTRWEVIQLALDGTLPTLVTQQMDLSALPRGKEVDVSASVIPLLEGVEVTCSPAKLTFGVKIRSATETLSLPVAVEVATPAAWAMAEDPTWKDYVLVTNPASEWRPILTVVGSKRDLLPENIRASVRLTDDDKKPVEGWSERPVSIDLSPGTSLRLQGAAPTVQFRLEKRPAPVSRKPKPATPPLVDSYSAN